jgi:hypothetical protein
MTFLNILVYVALIGYVLFKKVQGQPIRAPKKLLALPILLIVLGFGDLTSGKTMKPIEIALTVIGAVLSLGLGLMRGQADKVSTRDGSPFAQWGKASLGLFAANIVAKLVLDLVGVAAGGSASAAGKSLVFTLGLTLLGEALVLWMRSGGATALLNSQSATSGQPKDARSDVAHGLQPTADSFGDMPLAGPSMRYEMNDQADRPARPRAENPASWTTAGRGVGDAIAQHHSHHHDHKHDHGHRHHHDRS